MLTIELKGLNSGEGGGGGRGGGRGGGGRPQFKNDRGSSELKETLKGSRILFLLACLELSSSLRVTNSF